MATQYHKYYAENCSKVDARTFGTVKAEILKHLASPKCPPDVKVMFGSFLFKKIYLLFKFRYADEKRPIVASTFVPIAAMNDLILKSEYLQYLDVEASNMTCQHFYLNRFNDEEKYFIVQLLNDTQLIKGFTQNLSDSELKDHFLDWIETVPLEEQRSNILDVLLRYYPRDTRVRAVYENMQFGNSKGNRSVFADAQNVHDEEIDKETIRVSNALIKWGRENPVEPPILFPTTPKTWVEDKLRKWYGKNDVCTAIVTRAAIDTTTFGSGFTIFDLLFTLIYFIIVKMSADQQDLIKIILMEEFEASKALCASGYVGRFMSVLQGQDGCEEYQTSLPVAKKIYAVLSMRLSKSLEKGAPEEVMLGTTYPEHHKAYLDHVAKVVNAAMPALIADEGIDCIRPVIDEIMRKMTGLKNFGWGMGENGYLSYQLSEPEDEANQK